VSFSDRSFVRLPRDQEGKHLKVHLDGTNASATVLRIRGNGDNLTPAKNSLGSLARVGDDVNRLDAGHLLGDRGVDALTSRVQKASAGWRRATCRAVDVEAVLARPVDFSEPSIRVIRVREVGAVWAKY